MGEQTVMQESLFYGFSLEGHVPQDHLLRSIDWFVNVGGIREHLRPYYSETGRPSIDPELMIRMLIVGYSLGIRSERRLCEEVHLNLAYRWFCRLVSTARCPTTPLIPRTATAASVTATCYATIYLIDVKHAVIMDVEASTAVRQAEVTAAKRMIERVHNDLGIWLRKLIGDTGYGSAANLAWLVHERVIEPHILVFDKSSRIDGTFSRGDFAAQWGKDRSRFRQLEPRPIAAASIDRSIAQ